MEPKSGTILIVEDNSDVGEMCVLILTKAGYGVRWAQSRAAALTAMKNDRYDVVILDYTMPGMLVDEFITLASTHQIILMSALTDIEDYTTRFGLKYALQKPFQPRELIAVVQRLLESGNSGKPAAQS